MGETKKKKRRRKEGREEKGRGEGLENKYGVKRKGRRGR